VPCAHCGCWVASKAIHGEAEDAMAGLVVVAIFALLAILVIVVLAALSGRSGSAAK